MQPLYYFNVKPALKQEIIDEDEQQHAIMNTMMNRKAPKEASTPFFLGSPVNIDTNLQRKR